MHSDIHAHTITHVMVILALCMHVLRQATAKECWLGLSSLPHLERSVTDAAHRCHGQVLVMYFIIHMFFVNGHSYNNNVDFVRNWLSLSKEV